MTKQEAINIGRSNASEAIDQAHEYQDAYASYWTNVIDSVPLVHRDRAIDAYRALYADLKGATP